MDGVGHSLVLSIPLSIASMPEKLTDIEFVKVDVWDSEPLGGGPPR
jgi:hypothetical protein